MFSTGTSLYEITGAPRTRIAISGRPANYDVLVWGNKHGLVFRGISSPLQLVPLLCIPTFCVLGV